MIFKYLLLYILSIYFYRRRSFKSHIIYLYYKLYPNTPILFYKLIRIYKLFTFFAFNVHFYHPSFLVIEKLQELFL